MYDEFFKMFTKTGNIGYYMLFREINREMHDKHLLDESVGKSTNN